MVSAAGRHPATRAAAAPRWHLAGSDVSPALPGTRGPAVPLCLHTPKSAPTLRPDPAPAASADARENPRTGIRTCPLGCPLCMCLCPPPVWSRKFPRGSYAAIQANAENLAGGTHVGAAGRGLFLPKSAVSCGQPTGFAHFDTWGFPNPKMAPGRGLRGQQPPPVPSTASNVPLQKSSPQVLLQVQLVWVAWKWRFLMAGTGAVAKSSSLLCALPHPPPPLRAAGLGKSFQLCSRLFPRMLLVPGDFPSLGKGDRAQRGCALANTSGCEPGRSVGEEKIK